MLRYLTHKLRTQSLNETEHFHSKGNDDHDSGTESDDENADIEELQKYMATSILLGSRPQTRSQVGRGSGPAGAGGDQLSSGGEGGPDRPQLLQPSSRSGSGSKSDVESPPALDSALPSDSDHNFDHHSSEEELEVINCVQDQQAGPSAAATSASAEKRKWSQANRSSLSEEHSSGDDEIRDLVCFSTPVEFRTSPPANVHKPSRSPPPKVFHSANLPPHELCSVSPRKRHRRTPTGTPNTSSSSSGIQRPSLDFEKMQQIRVRLV